MRSSEEAMNKVLGSSGLGKSIFPTFQIGVPMPPITVTTGTGGGTTTTNAGTGSGQVATGSGNSSRTGD